MVVIHNPQPQDQLHPADIAIDPFTHHLYWTDQISNVINVTRIGNTMTPIGVVVKGPHQRPRSIVLAPEKGYVKNLHACSSLNLFNIFSKNKY